jgi:hypothetical protein
MFMIYSPQSMQLLAPTKGKDDPPEVHGTVTFDHEGEDVSKCRMIITSNDRVWTYTFNTRGLLVDSAYEDDATRKAKAEAEKKAEADAKAAREKEQAAAKESADHELKTKDDTTAADVSWDAKKDTGTVTPAPSPNPFAKPAFGPMESQHG